MLSVTRKSFGRSAQLGQFYDAHTDSLIEGCSLFSQSIPANLINSDDMSNSHFKYTLDHSLKQQFENLEIEQELKASLMAGLVSVQGSGKYLSEHKKSFKSVKGTMVYEIRTKSESINLNNQELQPLFSSKALHIDSATHVVVRVDWGAKSIATFEHVNTENLDKRSIERRLEGCLDQMGKAITGSVEVDLDDDERNLCACLEINYYGDFISNGRLPTTVHETVSLMKEVPSLIQKSNNGKGVAHEFALMPIKDVENLMGLESKIDRKLVELNEQSIDRVQQELDDFLVQKQQFYDAKSEIDSNANLFADSILDAWHDKARDIQRFESEFRSKLGKLLVDIRSGAKVPSELESFLELVGADPSKSAAGVKQFLTDNSRIFNKLNLIRDYKQLGIRFLGKTEMLFHFIQMNRTKDVYVLVCGEQIASQDLANYHLNLDFFMQLRHEKEDDTDAIFLVHDVGLHSVISNPVKSQAAVVYYSNGRKVDADYRRSTEMRNSPVARSHNMVLSAKAPPQAHDVFLNQQFSQKSENLKEIRIQKKSSKTLTGHSAFIRQVAFLPDGRLVSCSDDKPIKVWDTASAKELFELSGHTGWIATLAVLANGWLASGCRDGTIKLWDLEARREVKTLRGHTNAIFYLKALKNGNLVSCALDDTIKIWNPYLASKSPLLTITGHGNQSGYAIPLGVLSTDAVLACSHSDTDLLEDIILRVWDSSDGRLVKSLQTGLKSVQALLVLSNDQVAIGTITKTGAGTLKIIDLEDESKTKIIEKAHDSVVTCLLQLSNDNLVSSGADGSSSPGIHSIKIWAFPDLSLLQHIKTGQSLWISSLSLSPDETMLVSGSGDKTIKLWPLSIKYVVSQSN